jgi:hypothetical protein
MTDSADAVKLHCSAQPWPSHPWDPWSTPWPALTQWPSPCSHPADSPKTQQPGSPNSPNRPSRPKSAPLTLPPRDRTGPLERRAGWVRPSVPEDRWRRGLRATGWGEMRVRRFLGGGLLGLERLKPAGNDPSAGFGNSTPAQLSRVRCCRAPRDHPRCAPERRERLLGTETTPANLERTRSARSLWFCRTIAVSSEYIFH